MKKDAFHLNKAANLSKNWGPPLMKDRIAALTNSRFAIAVLDALFDKPIFQTSDLVTRTGIHKPTALGLLRQLKEAGILKEIRPASGRRPAVLCFARLLNSAEGKEVFSD